MIAVCCLVPAGHIHLFLGVVTRFQALARMYDSDHEGVTGYGYMAKKTVRSKQAANKRTRARSQRRATLRAARGQPKKKSISLGVKTALGSGTFEYRSKAAPAANGVTVVGRSPQVATSARGWETSVGSSVVFEVNPAQLGESNNVWTFDINPGLPEVFPQAAPHAFLFSEYRLDWARVRWIPGVGTQVSCRVGLATDSNVLATPPTTFTQLISYETAVHGQAWQDDIIMMVSNPEWKFVRSGPAPTGSDLKTYDAGWITLVIDPVSDTIPSVSLGMIVVDYKFTLKNRELKSPPGAVVIPAVQTTGSSGTLKAAVVFPPVFATLGSASQIQFMYDPLVSPYYYLGFPVGWWFVVANSTGDCATSFGGGSWNPLGLVATTENDFVSIAPAAVGVSVSTITGAEEADITSGASTYVVYASQSATPQNPGTSVLPGWFQFNFDNVIAIGDTTALANAMIFRVPEALVDQFIENGTFPTPSPLGARRPIRSLKRPRALKHSTSFKALCTSASTDFTKTSC